MRLHSWKFGILGLTLCLMELSVWAGDTKTAQVKSKGYVASHTLSNSSDEELFDTRLISRAQEIETQAPVPSSPAPLPAAGCATPKFRSPDQAVPAPAAPNLVAPPPAPDMSNQPFGSLSAGQGILTAQADVPAFLGDFFGGSGLSGTGPLFSSYGSGSIDGGQDISGQAFSALSGNAGLLKLAEATSPLPRDRVFFSYNYFDNVALNPRGVNVNRITPGVEKTFFDGNASVELRVPMAWTLRSTISSPAELNSNGGDFELGNVTLFSKFVLAQSENMVLTGGLGVALPTADDIRLNDGDTEVVHIRNDAVHLLPFVGGVYTPSDRWFSQGLLQIDVATQGQRTTIGGANAGRLNEPTFMFLSLGTGYWMYRSDSENSWLTGLAPIVEVHLNQTLQELDSVSDDAGNTVGQVNGGHITTVNTVIGLTSQMGQDKTLTLGYVAPLGGGADQVFDGELRVMFNWYFGGRLNRMSRVQF